MGAGSHSQLVSRLLSPLVMHHLLGALSLCQAQQELMSKLVLIFQTEHFGTVRIRGGYTHLPKESLQ